MTKAVSLLLAGNVFLPGIVEEEGYVRVSAKTACSFQVAPPCFVAKRAAGESGPKVPFLLLPGVLKCGGSAGNRVDEGLLLDVIAEVVPPFPPFSVLDTHHLCALSGPPLGIR